MAELPEALEAALIARFPRPTIKSAPTSRRGLLARMNALANQFSGTPHQRDQQAAQAAGIGRSTWDFWRAGKRQPSAASLRKLQTAYELDVVEPKWGRSILRRMPSVVHITAVVVGQPDRARYKNRKRGGPANEEGWRTFRADGLDVPAIVEAWRTVDYMAAADVLLSEIEAVYGEPFGFEGEHVEVEFH